MHASDRVKMSIDECIVFAGVRDGDLNEERRVIEFLITHKSMLS